MRVLKKMLSVFLAAVIMATTLCAGTISAGAAGKGLNLTVDGFYNQDDEYCIRIDGLTHNQMYYLDLYTTDDNLFTLIELELRTGNNKYYFKITNDLISGLEINNIDFTENGKSTEISFDGRFYGNKNSDGSYTYGYVIFIPKDSEYIEKLTSCTAASVGAGLLEFGTHKKIGLDEEYKLQSVKPKFDAKKTDGTKDISDLSISTPTNKTYTGKNRKATVTVKDGDYTLKSGTDYTLSYKNCKEIGTATVTIKGKGDYTGTKTLTYKIVPKKTTLKTSKKTSSKVTLSWSAVSGAEKYQIYYSVNGGKYKKLSTVSGSKTSTTISKLDFEKNDYKFKIRSYAEDDGKKYYSSFSSVKTVK